MLDESSTACIPNSNSTSTALCSPVSRTGRPVLTTVETFCVEIINALGHPTVNEFSSFVNISPPNAAYKINSLIQKGYVTKEQSPDDKREYHLSVTQKYFDYCNISQR